MHSKARINLLGRSLICLSIKSTRKERPPPLILGRNCIPICSFAHQDRVLEFLFHDRKRSFDPQAGAMPLFGHRTSSLFLPAQAVSSFFRARGFAPPLFFLFLSTYVQYTRTYVLQLHVCKIVSEFFTLCKQTSPCMVLTKNATGHGTLTTLPTFVELVLALFLNCPVVVVT